jgi:amino acid transporter
VTRAFLAWAFDRLLPRRIADVSPRTHTPVWAIGLVALLGEGSLILYATHHINTLNGIWAWILSFCVTSFAAIVFPYRRRALFEASPFNRRIGGIPAISILGAVSLAALGFCEYLFWADPVQGLASNHYMQKWTIGVFASGFAFYTLAYLVQRAPGIRVERVFAEIPPE